MPPRRVGTLLARAVHVASELFILPAAAAAAAGVDRQDGRRTSSRRAAEDGRLGQ